MRTGLDTNVLVYAHVPGFAQHAVARAFVQKRLARLHGTVVVTPMVLHELVHVITDPRRFDPPVTMGEALEVARRYLRRSNVECMAVDEAAVTRALELLEEHRLGRRHVADCLLAGTLLRHGVTELATYNPDDFRRFDGLHVVVPS
jgi:toxin-antitoxin system PIN domain toxin